MLVYKQTVLPLTEYVSFVMCLNNKHDVDKLQVLQNRALRMCYNIHNPRDISLLQLHERAKVDMLHKRRTLQLLPIMYEARTHLLYQEILARNTRIADKYTDNLYAKNVSH